MSILSEDRIKRGKQKRYVNSNVKEFDSEIYGKTNLFGESIEECMPEKFQHIVQLGNIRVNRTNFGNPQQFRIFSPKGECPTLNCCFPPLIFIKPFYSLRLFEYLVLNFLMIRYFLFFLNMI